MAEAGKAIMIQAQATARYVRTSAQKAGLVLDLIRGKDVNRALATLKFTPRAIAARHREGAALGDRQRPAEGRVQRRRRSAVRVGVLRQPGAVAEARAAGADGPRVPRAEAHRAPDRARVASGREKVVAVGGAPRRRSAAAPRKRGGGAAKKPTAASRAAKKAKE